MIDRERIVAQFAEMVAIASTSRHEGVFAAYCTAFLRGLGFAVRFDDSAAQTGSDTGNLIATLQGTTSGRLALSAHMDTVVPCEGIEVKRVSEERIVDGERAQVDVLCSAGDTILSADDKAGVAAIFEALEAIVEDGKPHPEITVILTIGEEKSLLGARNLTPDPSFEGLPCYVFDADGAPGTIILGAPYHYSFVADFSGRAAHAGVEPEKGLSAIEMAARAIAGMPCGRIDEHTTANVGVIDGGEAKNIVAAHCRVEGECRSLYQDRAEEQKRAMETALRAGAAELGDSVEISWVLDYPGVLYGRDDPLVVSAARAAAAAGLPVRYAVSGGGADTNVFPRVGLAPLTLGIGMEDYHSLDEHILVDDLENTARLAYALIEEYA